MLFDMKLLMVFVVGVVSVIAEEKLKNETTTTQTQLKTPEYIIPCYKSDPKINDCLQVTFNHLRPYLVSGINDINVPSIDPLRIERLVMENGQGAFNIKAVFHNVTAAGASNYNVTRIKADVEKYNIEIGFAIPKVEIKGKYEVTGNVLLFPVRSRGDFWAVFLDVNAASRIYGKEFKDKNGVRFMKIDRMVVDFKLARSRFRVRDNINHGNLIGEAMNHFLNSNSDEIINEMRPAANAAIAKHFKGFLNSAFLQLPLKVWLPDA